MCSDNMNEWSRRQVCLCLHERSKKGWVISQGVVIDDLYRKVIRRLAILDVVLEEVDARTRGNW